VGGGICRTSGCTGDLKQVLAAATDHPRAPLEVREHARGVSGMAGWREHSRAAKHTHTHRGVACLTDNSYMYALSSLTA
jgi:hypothetical protein